MNRQQEAGDLSDELELANRRSVAKLVSKLLQLLQSAILSSLLR